MTSMKKQKITSVQIIADMFYYQLYTQSDIDYELRKYGETVNNFNNKFY